MNLTLSLFTMMFFYSCLPTILSATEVSQGPREETQNKINQLIGQLQPYIEKRAIAREEKELYCTLFEDDAKNKITQEQIPQDSVVVLGLNEKIDFLSRSIAPDTSTHHIVEYIKRNFKVHPLFQSKPNSRKLFSQWVEGENWKHLSDCHAHLKKIYQELLTLIPKNEQDQTPYDSWLLIAQGKDSRNRSGYILQLCQYDELKSVINRIDQKIQTLSDGWFGRLMNKSEIEQIEEAKANLVHVASGSYVSLTPMQSLDENWDGQFHWVEVMSVETSTGNK